MVEIRIPISDDYVFKRIMELNPGMARHLLKLAAGSELDGVDLSKLIISKEQVVDPKIDAKAIRFDLFMISDRLTADLEMQTTVKADLVKRARYYISSNDVKVLTKGSKYSELPKSIVVFICTFDPFKQGYYRYLVKERVFTDDDLKEDVTDVVGYDSGYVKIFLNTEGTKGNINEDLLNFLKYVKTKKPEDRFTEELDEQVDVVNNTDREELMTLQEKLDSARKDGIEEGKAKGLAEGREEERKAGLRALVSTLMSFLPNDKEIYHAVTKNETYSKVTFETVKEIIDDINSSPQRR